MINYYMVEHDMTKKKRQRFVWLARTSHIRWSGCYKSYAEAIRAVRGYDGAPLPGACAWPVTKKEFLEMSKDHEEEE